MSKNERINSPTVVTFKTVAKLRSDLPREARHDCTKGTGLKSSQFSFTALGQKRILLDEPQLPLARFHHLDVRDPDN